MEAEKVKEKAKRGENRLLLSPFFFWGLLIFALLSLTVFTSYASLAVFPEPRFFYWGSIILGMGQIYLSIILTLLSLVKSRFRAFIAIAALLFLCGIAFGYEILLVIGGLGTWFMGIPYYFLNLIPKIVFPLLLLAVIIWLIRRKLLSVGSQSYLAGEILPFLLLSGFYLWGHAISFEGNFYDEGLEIEGKSYHSIVYYGWLGDPGYVYLYECQMGYFLCTMVYQSPYDSYYAESTKLVYDEAAQLLRVSYDSQYTDNIPPILYEHPIP